MVTRHEPCGSVVDLSLHLLHRRQNLDGRQVGEIHVVAVLGFDVVQQRAQLLE